MSSRSSEGNRTWNKKPARVFVSSPLKQQYKRLDGSIRQKLLYIPTKRNISETFLSRPIRRRRKKSPLSARNARQNKRFPTRRDSGVKQSKVKTIIWSRGQNRNTVYGFFERTNERTNEDQQWIAARFIWRFDLNGIFRSPLLNLTVRRDTAVQTN